MIYLVIEFAAGGDLLDYIINRGGLCECISLFAPTATNKTKAEHETKEIARQMCAAMAYTHEKGITHRDLKPEVSIDICAICLNLHSKEYPTLHKRHRVTSNQGYRFRFS